MSTPSPVPVEKISIRLWAFDAIRVFSYPPLPLLFLLFLKGTCVVTIPSAFFIHRWIEQPLAGRTRSAA